MICDRCEAREIREAMLATDAYRAHCNGALITATFLMLALWPIAVDRVGDLIITFNLVWHLFGIRRAWRAKRGGGAGA